MSTEFIHTLVSEEIRHIVTSAKSDGGCISASASAERILRTYPNCGLAERDLVDDIILAAAKAGVAVEIGRAESGELRSSAA